MSHYHQIEDAGGDPVALVYFCSDGCHRQWCRDRGIQYRDWDSCHELEHRQWCANCGATLAGLLTEDGEPITA